MNGKVSNSFIDGWRVFYQARTIFVALLILVMVVNIAIFIATSYSDIVKPVLVTDSMGPGPAGCYACPLLSLGAKTASAPATLPVSVMPNKQYSQTQISKARRWANAFSSVMLLTGVIGVVSAIFLLFCAAIGLMMIISGQLPGAGPVCGAFFWSVGIIVLLLPWSNIFPSGVFLPLGVAGFAQLKASMSAVLLSSGSWVAYIPLWFKFVVYPILIILFAVMYFGRTSQSNLQIMATQAGDTRQGDI